ncbi:MAG: IS30 family transposase [Gammaproteobacteria bacterium]|nr:IS30 family transposase [Gammaproteobacteria bacterium]
MNARRVPSCSCGCQARDATSVRQAFARKLKHVPKQMKLSLTYDRGKEMTEHRLFTRDTQMAVYFAHPQSPWERGTNENTNGLIRQYFPKGTDFNEVSAYQIRKAQDRLNGRPRKVLKLRRHHSKPSMNCCVRIYQPTNWL